MSGGDGEVRGCGQLCKMWSKKAYLPHVMFILCFHASYFNDNQYPDEAKREEIANACNAVIQKPGRMFKQKLYKEDECMCKCLLSWPQTLLMSSAVI